MQLPRSTNSFSHGLAWNSPNDGWQHLREENSETYRRKLNNGLSAFLIPPEAKKGINSGLMTAQYTAAALASQNKVLAHPACADSIPTSANFEDFVSIGVVAAQKAMQILENVEYIVAIELLCAVQAIGFRGPESSEKKQK